MAINYEPQNFVDGQLLTAECLNRMEEGIKKACEAGGASAYEIAVSNGFEGTEAEWLASLEGKDGASPYIGSNGNWWIGSTDTGVSAAGLPTGGTEGQILTMGADGVAVWTTLETLPSAEEASF